VTAADFDWLVKGYRRALARFAASADSRDPEERFIPLFEALNWIASILDVQRKRGSAINDETARALGFARNRVHHQWADALEPRDLPNARIVSAASGSRIVTPPTRLDWFWKPEHQLPEVPPRFLDEQGEAAYSDVLAGHPASLALAHMDGLLPPPQDG
jgi:hypothetical protein